MEMLVAVRILEDWLLVAMQHMVNGRIADGEPSITSRDFSPNAVVEESVAYSTGALSRYTDKPDSIGWCGS